MPVGGSRSVASADLEAARRVKKVNAKTWIGIAQWGAQTGKLHWRQTGIVTTLSGMSAQGWARDPSPKQVKAAIDILNAVEQHQPSLLSDG